MTDESKSGPSFDDAYLVKLQTELESRGWQPDSRGDAECVDEASAAAADVFKLYKSLRTRLSAVEAERDRIRRAACEAMALIGELCPIDFKDTDKGEKYAARAHDMLFAALASESSATTHNQESDQ